MPKVIANGRNPLTKDAITALFGRLDKMKKYIHIHIFYINITVDCLTRVDSINMFDWTQAEPLIQRMQLELGNSLESNYAIDSIQDEPLPQIDSGDLLQH